MNKKVLFFISALLVIVCACSICAFAAEPVTTTYLKAGGSGDGLTAETPTGSLNSAMGALTADGTVVFLNEFTISAVSHLADIEYDCTFVSDGGCLTLAADLDLKISKNDNVVTFDLPVKVTGTTDINLMGGYNNVVFGNGFSVTSTDGAALNFYGGRPSESETGICTRAYSITVNAGTFGSFNGGNYRETISGYYGSIAAPITITVNGGTFGKGDVYTATNNKNYNAFSVSGMSILADDATLTINGGTFNCPVFVQGKTDTIPASVSEKCTLVASSKDYYAIDGDITVNITGGTFNGGAVSAYYTQAAYTTVMRGNYDVTVTGGTFAQNTVFDATQVKAYEGGSSKATLTYSGVSNVTPVRFDLVNGEAQTYDEPIRVVFIGDSITEGYVISGAGVVRLTDGYPAQFLKLCEDAGKEVIVGNFGVSSAGFHPVTKRFYHNMLAYPVVREETDADYVFFAMGINDANTSGGTTSAMRTYEKNLYDFAEYMGNLPDTEKVFITNALYAKTGSAVTTHRASAVMRPTQERVANELAAKAPDKYVFVDMFGLTLSAAKDDSLFRADNGTIYERLHPAQTGLKLMASVCYNAAFNGVTAPESYRMTDIYVSASGTAFGAGTAADPISDLGYAYDLMERDVPVTLHIIGNVSLAHNLYTSMAPSKLTIVGEGSDAALTVNSSSFKIGSDIKIDNLTIGSGTSGISILGCFNNIEFTDTVKTSGKVGFYAGHNVFQDVDPATVSTHDCAEYVSSDRDLTVIINGGNYSSYALGNGRFSGLAPFGTYSGTMTAVLGSNVTVGNENATYVGIVGCNYLTGTVDIEINGWGKDTIKEFCPTGSVTAPLTYCAEQNTGNINAVIAPDVASTLLIVCDFDGDSSVTVKDAMLAISYMLNGFDSAKADNYYGQNLSRLIEVLRIFKKAAA